MPEASRSALIAGLEELNRALELGLLSPEEHRDHKQRLLTEWRTGIGGPDVSRAAVVHGREDADLAGLDLDSWPTFLATALTHWADETHPVQRLWRICDAVELLVRYLATIALAERIRRADGRLPEALAGPLSGRLERPTLGAWLGIAKAALDDDDDSPLLRHAREAFTERVARYIGTATGDAAENLLPLRNLLAHGGGMTRRSAEALRCGPDGHEARARTLFLTEQHWLAEGRVLYVPRPEDGDGDDVVLLRGLRPSRSPASAMDPELRAYAGQVVLVDNRGIVPLWPLFGFGRPEVVRAGRPSLIGQGPVPQVYVRAEPSALLYNALGGDLPFCQRSGDALECFRRLFLVRREGPARPSGLPDFTAELAAEAEKRVGREAELERILEAVASQAGGVLWVSGVAGIGKSTLMASLACHHKVGGDPRKRLVVAHRFKSGDARCSRDAFLRQAVDRLQRWPPLERGGQNLLGVGTEREAGENVDSATAEPKALTRRFRELLELVAQLPAPTSHARSRPPQVLFVLDGLDEGMRVDPRLLDLPFEHTYTNVSWLCAGRPEPPLVERFVTRGPSASIFPRSPEQPEGGLPPMGPLDIRAMLLHGAEQARYLLLAREVDSDGATNDFVEAVVSRSAGLPLYVDLVLQDLVRRQVRADAAADLPETLEAYYEDLLSRYAIDDLQQVLTPLVATLAVGIEPLDEVALHALLAHRRVVTADADGAQLVRRGLQAAGTILRLAPTPEGGFGYTPYHDTFRRHVAEQSPRTRVAAVTAREALAAAAAAWADDSLAGARNYLLRCGVGHLLDTGRAEAAVALLADFRFAEGVATAAGASALATGYNHVAAALAPTHPQRRIMDLLGKALRLDRAFLAHHPESLFQTLWNRCWWYDSPQTAQHYHAEENPKRMPPWDTGGEKLYVLMDNWRKQVEARPEFVWLQARQPPEHQLGTALLGVLGGFAGAMECVASSHDGRTLASASQDHTVCLWDLEHGVATRTLRGHEAGILGVAFSPDGRHLVSASQDKTIRLWDTNSGSGLKVLRGHEWDVTAVSFSPSGAFLVSGSTDATVRLWDVDSGAEIKVLRGHEYDVMAVAFSPDGTLLASGSKDRTIRIWEVESGVEVRLLRGHWSWVRCLAFSPDGCLLASGSKDDTIRIWEVESGIEVRLMRGHGSAVLGLAFHPAEPLVVSGSRDRTIRVWSTESGAEVQRIGRHDGDVTSVNWLAGGETVVSASKDESLRLWRVDGEAGYHGCAVGLGASEEGGVFSLDGRYAATGADAERVFLWELESTAPPHTLQPSRRRPDESWPANQVTFSPDSRYLAWTSPSGVFLWSLRLGTEGQIVTLTANWAQSLAFSPDSTLIAEGADGRIHVFAVNGTGKWGPLVGGTDCLAFSPDGRHLASGSGREVQLWDLKTGLALWSRQTRDGPVRFLENLTCLAFGPDGHWLALGSEDGSVRIWDARNGEELRSLSGPRWIARVAIGPDGRQLASLDVGSVARLWDIESGRCLSTTEGAIDIHQLVRLSHSAHSWLPVTRNSWTRLVRSGMPDIARLPSSLSMPRVSPFDPRLLGGTSGGRFCLYELRGNCGPEVPTGTPGQESPARLSGGGNDDASAGETRVGKFGAVLDPLAPPPIARVSRRFDE